MVADRSRGRERERERENFIEFLNPNLHSCIPPPLQHQLIYLAGKVNQVNPQGFNVQPGLIYIGPIGVNVQPQGASFQPVGISVAPVGAAAQPVGASITPTRVSIGDVGVGYTPHGRDDPDDPTDDDGVPIGGL